MKVKLAIKRSYGDITLEGDGLDEIVASLKAAPEWLDIIDALILRTESPTSRKDFLRGIIEFTSEGTVLVTLKESISDKEAICLILYANDPTPVQPKDVARLLTISGRLSPGFGARLSELRSEGFIIKEGSAYRLTASGKRIAEEVVQRISH